MRKLLLGSLFAFAINLSPLLAHAQSSPNISKGAELFAVQCVRCHKPRDAMEYSDREWIVIMQHMRTRANLTGTDTRAIRDFLLAQNNRLDPSKIRAKSHSSSSVQTTSTGDTKSFSKSTIAAGRNVYFNKGACFACHGRKLEGGPLAPPLNDKESHHGNDYESILHVIQDGVSGTNMTALSGGINDDEAKAVAAYLFSVSQGTASP